jgi:PhnB protein
MNTNTKLNPYIFFNGKCEEAIAFYAKTVGAKQLMLMHYKDAPPEVKSQQCGPAGSENWVMHARLQIGDSTILLSDGPCSGKYDGFALSLTVPSPAEAERSFKALSDGGKVDMPLNKTFFSPSFGMLTDRFGVKWMVYVEGAS